jgi:cytochrome c biogenesis protein CcdA/thiol-disulfide isomerase/thioredoxin
MFLLFGAFLAGALTVLAPCVLPLLPIIVGGSVTGDTKDRSRPFVIAIALAASLFLFTLLLKASTLLINISPNLLNYISGGILVLLGIVMFMPVVYAKMINRLGIEQQAQKALGKGYTNKRKYIGPIIIGAALGPVFSSCSPVYAYILATVLPVHFAQAIAYVIAYILGLSIFLLLIGFYGQRFISRIKFARDPKGWFQRTIAVIFIVVGTLILTGLSKQFQTYISIHTPFNFDGISQRLLPTSKHKTNDTSVLNVSSPYPAPDFTGINTWINSPPLTIGSLKGKVVYVDFWTYSCINCIRNDPYIEKWYNTYKSDGFEVVGVHAPEFSFEQVPANVEKAVKSMGITYPVALDNQLATWNAYNNESWPAGYLIDAHGDVRRIYLGEGQYTQTEQAIRELLRDNGAKVTQPITTTNDSVPITANQTPETYLGTNRASDYAGSPGLLNGTSNFTPNTNLDPDDWSLGGSWNIGSTSITAGSNATLQFHVEAKHIYIVAGGTVGAHIGVMLNGKPVSQTDAGSDVTNGAITITGPKLYNVVNFPSFTSSSTIELSVPKGVSINTFTFGS